MASVNQEPNEGPTVTADASDEIVAASTTTASADLLANSMGDYVKILGRRGRSGESGALPVVIGLIAIVIFFQVRTSGLELSPRNLVNLMEQSAFVIILGMAEIFVLLLGDIDLAAGFTAACGAVIGLWMLALGDSWWLSLIVTLAVCAAYGVRQGESIPRLKLASGGGALAGRLGLPGARVWL